MKLGWVVILVVAAVLFGYWAATIIIPAVMIGKGIDMLKKK